MNIHEEEQKMKDTFNSDLQEMVSTYRTFKNIGKWLAALFAFLLVLASLALAVKEFFKK